jgi:phosphohistidine swiveling domain-containing protein
VKHLIEGWLEKHGYIPVNFCEEPWSMDDGLAQFNNACKCDAKKEIIRLEDEHRKRIMAKKKALAKIGRKEIIILADAIAEGTYLNEFRKNIFSKVSLGCKPVFTEIAKRCGSEDWKDCYFMSPPEMIRVLEGEKIDLLKMKKDRAAVAMTIVDDSGTHFIDKETTRKLKEYIESTRGDAVKDETTDNAVRGFCANRGIVRGIVKIVLSSKDFHKFKPGEILVTTMTSVDFVPIMEKAAAFVTNEGGLTSHASIVAREMNKPCVIGTKNATKVLKDGDLVEVDANKGIVKLLRKA